MKQRFEYKFVKMGEGWLVAKKSAMHEYQREIEKHAAEGWRFVQVFAPSMGVYGASKYFEIIFEREIS